MTRSGHNWGPRVALCSALLLLLVAHPRVEQQREFVSAEVMALPAPTFDHSFICGTLQMSALQRGLRVQTMLADNQPMSFQQLPRIVDPAQTGQIRIVTEIMGDVSSVTFRLYDPNQAERFTRQTWNRKTTRTVDGRIVSIFDQSFPASVLRELLLWFHGYDWPQVTLGHLEIPGGTGTPELVAVRLRLAPSNLASSTVRKINDRVQYASHVVNLVMPNFGDSRVMGGEQVFNLAQVAQFFYEHFQDLYHSLAFIPQASPLAAGWDGFNRDVWNNIQGIGAQLLDQRSAFGSNRLRSVQVFETAYAAVPSVAFHELLHHFGFFANLADTPSGGQPEAHMPLLTPGESIMSQLLSEKFRVTSGGTNQIERTPIPIRVHSLMMYLAGVTGVNDIPDVDVFNNQSQLTSTEPAAGTMVTGGTKRVTINDIVAKLGPRSGPTFPVWRTAVVVVSRDGLISKKEMDYYNFYAKRIAENSGVRTYEGLEAFNEMTQDGMNLRTDIDPKNLSQNPKVSGGPAAREPRFGKTEWRGIVLDNTVPSRLPTGQRVTFAGGVDTSVDSKTYVAAEVRLSEYGDGGNVISKQGNVTNGRFSIDITFSSDQAGSYAMQMYLFEQGVSSFQRANVIPFTVGNPSFETSSP